MDGQTNTIIWETHQMKSFLPTYGIQLISIRLVVFPCYHSNQTTKWLEMSVFARISLFIGLIIVFISSVIMAIINHTRKVSTCILIKPEAFAYI